MGSTSLDEEVLREITFGYLEELSRAERQRFTRYQVELSKLLYDRDPDRIIELLWSMLGSIRYIGQADSELLKLLRIWDPQRTIEAVVGVLSQEKRLRGHLPVAFLEAMEAPETDELLTKDLDTFVQQLKGGSKHWRGGGLSYWRKSLRNTVQAVGRRRLEAAATYLAAIALRDEPQNLKLDCVDALVRIGSDDIIGVLVKLLDDRFERVRSRASKHLSEMNQQRDTIVMEITKSIATQESHKYRNQEMRSGVMKTKIRVLCRLQATQATEVLERIAQNDSDESVRGIATRAIKMLGRARGSV